MSKNNEIDFKFTQEFPKELEEQTLYISTDLSVASHMCACGCDNEVITPLSPKNWILIFDGDTVSIHPSIGNWSLPCQSHYWIERNKIVWAENWTKDQILSVRKHNNRIYGYSNKYGLFDGDS